MLYKQSFSYVLLHMDVGFPTHNIVFKDKY